MKTSPKKTTVSGTKPKKKKKPLLKNDNRRLDRALFFADDLFGRASIVWFVIDELARQLHDGLRLDDIPEISVAEIIRLIDGPLAAVESVSKNFYRQTPIQKNKALKKLFSEIRNLVSQKLENTTLDKL